MKSRYTHFVCVVSRVLHAAAVCWYRLTFQHKFFKEDIFGAGVELEDAITVVQLSVC